MNKYILTLLAVLLPSLALAQPCIGPCPSPFNSPVLVLATPGATSLTGTANGVETNITNLKIPANSMGKNGTVTFWCLYTYTNSANNKTMVVHFNGNPAITSGAPINTGVVATTTAMAQVMYVFHNNNATNAQTAYAATATAPFATSAAAPNTFTVDTTADTYLNFSGNLALGSETITVQHCTALVMKAP